MAWRGIIFHDLPQQKLFASGEESLRVSAVKALRVLRFDYGSAERETRNRRSADIPVRSVAESSRADRNVRAPMPLGIEPFGIIRESQRDSDPKPRVASRELPWEKRVVSANPNDSAIWHQRTCQMSLSVVVPFVG